MHEAPSGQALWMIDANDWLAEYGAEILPSQ